MDMRQTLPELWRSHDGLWWIGQAVALMLGYAFYFFQIFFKYWTFILFFINQIKRSLETLPCAELNPEHCCKKIPDIFIITNHLNKYKR